MTPVPLTHPELRVRHGFFSRQGGISTGIYGGIHAGLNCGYGSDDEPDAVRQNRQRVAESLTVEEEALVTVHQIHSATAIVADQPWRPGDAPRADGMVTATPGLALGILTADCTPVLFAEAEAGVIGAAHAGWRGALSGVLEATVQTMEDQGAQRSRIRAVVGPCIAQTSYEVGPEFKTKFIHQDIGYGQFFIPAAKPKHYQFDLAGFVMARLTILNLCSCHDLALDTYADDEKFYSYRRSCHRNESDYGRQISAITLATA